MDFKRKRTYTLSVAGLYLFLGGCEFAIIFPTVWDYLRSVGAEKEYWIGLIVSAYSFSAAIAGVIGGRLADKYEAHTKRIVLVAMIIMTIGSFQYTLGYSVWNILASRLVCGLGTAAGAALIAHLCRATEPHERTPILAILNATRQLGILIGPAFQLGLQKVSFKIWGWTVTPLNGPGLFMGFVWLLFSIYTLFVFQDMTEEIQERIRDRRIGTQSPAADESQGQNRAKGNLAEPNSNPDNPIVSDIVSSRSRSYSGRFFDSLTVGQAAGEVDLMQASGATLRSAFTRYKDEFLTDTFILLVGMTFTMFFSHVAVEALIPVVMQDYFGYGIVGNSLVYMFGGLEALLIFFLMSIISRHVRDSTLLIVGWGVMILGQVWLMIAIPFFTIGSPNQTDLIIYLTGIVLLYIGYPIAATANSGLFSKAVSHETQGLAQGVRRLSSYIGLIFGPIWGGATVHNGYLSFGVPVSILLINSVMFAFSYKALRRHEDQQQDQLSEADTRSLISS